MTLRLSVALEDYEWLEPLLAGDVEAEGVELDAVAMTASGERHERMLDGEFDAAEFSLGTYVAGAEDLPFTAIPAFPRRFFPHPRIIVNREAGIETPADLAGSRAVLFSHQNTHGVWARGILAERHGLDPSTVTWYTTEPEPTDAPVPFEPRHVDRSVVRERLTDGTVDCLILSKAPLSYPLPENARPLFGDEEAAVTAYYEATGLVPVMHAVVVRDELLAEHPWLVETLLSAFQRSVAAFEARARYESKYPLVFWRRYRARERERFGDIWARSFEWAANAPEVETFVRYAAELGLTAPGTDPAALFAGTDA